jgi:Flp pilus assembly protein TadD
MAKYFGFPILIFIFALTSAVAAPETPATNSPSPPSNVSGTPAQADLPAEPLIPTRKEGYSEAPASIRGLVATIDGLAASGRWKSAWDALAAADPEHKDPWILARSIELVLDGYLETNMHMAFVLEDLPANVEPLSVRGSGKAADFFEFSPGSAAEAQGVAGTAAVPELDKALARYYSAVGQLYKGSWLLSDQEIAQRASEDYARARLAGVYDAESLVAEAELLLRSESAAEAEQILIAAETLDPNATRPRYDHAVSKLLQDLPLDAMTIIDATLPLDTGTTSRVSALSLGAQAATLAGDGARAEAYLSVAEKETPDRPDIGIFRHYLAIATGDSDKAAAVADGLIARFGGDPQLITALLRNWFQVQDTSGALAFLDRGLIAKISDDAASATLGFYKAVVLLQIATLPEELNSVQAILDESEARFHKAFPPEYEVFGVITNIRGEIASKLAEASAAGPPAEAPSPTP